MSKFFTGIPVDVAAVEKALPEGAFVERIVWNQEAGQVEIHWDHQPFHTGNDMAVEFTAEYLATQGNLLPEGVYSRKEYFVRQAKLLKQRQARRRKEAEERAEREKQERKAKAKAEKAKADVRTADRKDLPTEDGAKESGGASEAV